MKTVPINKQSPDAPLLRSFGPLPRSLVKELAETIVRRRER